MQISRELACWNWTILMWTASRTWVIVQKKSYIQISSVFFNSYVSHTHEIFRQFLFNSVKLQANLNMQPSILFTHPALCWFESFECFELMIWKNARFCKHGNFMKFLLISICTRPYVLAYIIISKHWFSDNCQINTTASIPHLTFKLFYTPCIGRIFCVYFHCHDCMCNLLN